MARRLLLETIAERLNAELIGDGACEIFAIQTLRKAGEGDIAFLANPQYKHELNETSASAVILSKSDASEFAGNRLVVDDPYLAYAQLTSFFSTPKVKQACVHSSAVIDPLAKVDSTASIGAHVYIASNTVIEPDVVIGSGVSIGEDCYIRRGTQIYANATLYSGVSVGENCIIHSGAIIGADGFGFAHDGKSWVKIHQLGGVSIGNGVEIGACATVDRGALDNTELADGVILDNHVQIAHNVKVGKNTAMAAFSGISGSSVIGENCTFAGRSGVVGHITICAGVHVSAGTIITKTIKVPGSYSAGTGMSTTKQWRKNAVRFNQLDDIARRLTKIETNVKKT